MLEAGFYIPCTHLPAKIQHNPLRNHVSKFLEPSWSAGLCLSEEAATAQQPHMIWLVTSSMCGCRKRVPG